jgi:cytidylate kinase
MGTQPRIAIDGPAGVGKSTIGERLAKRLGVPYVDTGAFYRTLTRMALKLGIAPEDGAALSALARRLDIAIVPPLVPDGRAYTVLVDGVDVTPELRLPAVEAAVSQVSRHPAVREALIARMRALAGARGVVMVGRDIGTVVLPDADVKIYLTTSLEERAQRRHADLVALYGAAAPTLAEVRDDISQRDTKDAAQMHPASDAIGINNDHLEAGEVVERILELLAERWKN